MYNMRKAGWSRAWILALGLVSSWALAANGAGPSAFELIKEGNRYVGEPSKDKVVEIRSERSVASLSPDIWYIVFYDPDAPLKAVEVKFGAGKKLKVGRPLRLLEPVSGGDVAFDRSKLKMDSDRAIKIAASDPLLRKLKIKATQLTLERVGQGVLGRSGPGEPIWKVKLWAGKAHEPNRQVNVGEIWLSATDGKVSKRDLRPERVN
jgi:hypothetical protein